MNIKEQDILDKLQALRQAFAAQLPAKLTDISQCWQGLHNGNWDWEQADTLHRLVHTLTGSAPTFGFVALGTQAREAEQVIKSWVNARQIPNAESQASFSAMLVRLDSTMENPATETTAAEVNSLLPDADNHLIYIVDQDHDFSAELSLLLNQSNYHPKIYKTGQELLSAINKVVPAAIIIDAEGCNKGMPGTEIAAQLKQGKHDNIPLLILSNKADFNTRLQAVRCGCDSFITKPIDPALLVDKLDQFTQNDDHEPYRILIVDDDPALATHYQLTLQAAGMDAYTLSTPQSIMEILSDVRPDLIVMDVYMPGCSGLELAKLIRQQEAYVSTPIVYLSTEGNLDKQLIAMRIGGDDFLTKPIEDSHLVSSITIRAARSRLLNSFMIQDSLTGLLKHTVIKEHLVIEISRAIRAKTPLAFAMLDIDHFKKVNDSYGHITGDRVIKSLARLLQQRLRKTDSIGRYGGEEFAVVLPACDIDYAYRILNDIRDAFSRLTFNLDSQQFSATISIGIASLQNYHQAESINQAADEALYLAKERGRNRVVIADIEGIQSTNS